MFISSFLSFPVKERISGQNSLKKSCLKYDFASNWSDRMSFGHKKCTELSPMDIDWLFKKCTIRILMVHHYPHFPGASTRLSNRVRLGKHQFFFILFFDVNFLKIYRMPHITGGEFFNYMPTHGDCWIFPRDYYDMHIHIYIYIYTSPFVCVYRHMYIYKIWKFGGKLFLII